MNRDTHVLAEFIEVSFSYPVEGASVVFEDLSLALPRGILSISGENGRGKSTLLLMAAARLLPTQGSISLLGEDTANLYNLASSSPQGELQRSALASVIFQNMEIDSDEPVGAMLESVAANGFLSNDEQAIASEAPQALGIGDLLDRSFPQLSKGEMQRVLFALAACYGSQVLFLDEPFFAMEESWKQRSMEYISDLTHRSGRSLVYCAHDLDICKKYADNALLFHKDGNLSLGDPSAVLGSENLEAAYRVPVSTLYEKERLHRNMLIEKSGT